VPTLAPVWNLQGDLGHVPALDGLRGFAMFLVLVYHIVDYLPWRKPFAVGWCGIELFFVLSGFLITGLLLDSEGERHRLRNFYLRRALRILPLYYLVLIGLYLSIWLGGNAASERVLAEQHWFWLLIQNMHMALNGWYKPMYFSHFWSLAVEVQYYVVWPVVLVLVGAQRGLIVCALVAATSFTLRNALPISFPYSYAATFMRLEGVMIGSVLAILMRTRRELLGRLAPLVLVGAGVPLVLFALTPDGLHISSPWVIRIGYPLLALFFAAVLVSIFDTGRVGRASRAVFASRFCLWIGKYSYGIYLSHWVIHLKLRQPLLDWLTPLVGSLPVASTISFLIQGLLSIGFSVVSYHLVELPMMRLKNVLAPRPRGRLTEIGLPEIRRTA
jgi:peptidoglycan/LPS O-acetylase OafA/YrhL